MDEIGAGNVTTRWATAQDLEKSRPLIEQLYKDNKLAKVIEIMKSEHGLIATSVHPIPYQNLPY